MKIELGAGDGISHEDGKDRNIIAVIDGKQFILPIDKTVAQILEIGQKLSKKPLNFNPGSTRYFDDSEKGFTKDHLDTRNKEAEEIESNRTEIQVGDIVLYQPQPAGGYTGEERSEQMNGKTQIGAQYRVLSIPEDDLSIDIINDHAPTPQRITIPKFDVVLHKKTPKVHVQTKQQFEQIINCPNGCKVKKKDGSILGPEMVVLIREENQDHYEGTCQTCKQTFTAPYPTPAPEKAA